MTKETRKKVPVGVGGIKPRGIQVCNLGYGILNIVRRIYGCGDDEERVFKVTTQVCHQLCRPCESLFDALKIKWVLTDILRIPIGSDHYGCCFFEAGKTLVRRGSTGAVGSMLSWFERDSSSLEASVVTYLGILIVVLSDFFCRGEPFSRVCELDHDDVIRELQRILRKPLRTTFCVKRTASTCGKKVRLKLCEDGKKWLWRFKVGQEVDVLPIGGGETKFCGKITTFSRDEKFCSVIDVVCNKTLPCRFLRGSLVTVTDDIFLPSCDFVPFDAFCIQSVEKPRPWKLRDIVDTSTCERLSKV